MSLIIFIRILFKPEQKRFEILKISSKREQSVGNILQEKESTRVFGRTRDIQSSTDPNVGNTSPSSCFGEIISLRELSGSDALEEEGVLVLAATCT